MMKKRFKNIEELRAGKWGFAIDVGLFIVITVIFHKLWWNYQAEIQSISFIPAIQDYLAELVFRSSFWIDTHLLKLKVITEPGRILRFANNAFIRIDHSCAGTKQFYQILVLFLLFPGPWRHKAWYIPLSIFLMHLTNIFRIIVLSLISIRIPDQWHFLHDWVLRPFFYVVLFGLWIVWVERFSKSK